MRLAEWNETGHLATTRLKRGCGSCSSAAQVSAASIGPLDTPAMPAKRA
jgi:hypothetical protein